MGNRSTGLWHDCVQQVDTGEVPDASPGIRALGSSGRCLPAAVADLKEQQQCAEMCMQRCQAECAALGPRNLWASKLEPCECHERAGSWLFDDDAVLLERLEAANQGDRLLAKLHKNVMCFSNVACDIILALLRLTQHPQVWERGRGDLLQRSLHEGLQKHALPPARLLKALQWMYRAEEMPSETSDVARRCVLDFYAMTLAAAAAVKWRAAPPATWQRRGVDPVDVLRGAESRLFEVIAGLRFLACLALVQQFAESSMLGNRKLIRSLMRATGIKVPRGAAAAMAGEDERERLAKPSAILKADASWDKFFDEAQCRPGEQLVNLLRDLQHEADMEACPRLLPDSVKSAPKGVPNSTLWGDEEVVFCPGLDEKGMHWKTPSKQPEGLARDAFSEVKEAAGEKWDDGRWDDGTVLIPL